MNTHRHFEAGIELHSLSIIRYDRNINGMRPKFKESHFCPLNPPDADRLVHTSHTPPSRPKVVYPLAFAKARKKAVETIESGYGNMLRRSMGMAQGFLWEVLSGLSEFDGLGALRLTTEVTKARLRQFQSLISSTYDSETSLTMGMLQMAQRGGGLSHPVNMVDTKHLRLFQPVDSTAHQVVHLNAKLRELGCKLAVGWVSRPLCRV